MIIFIIGLSSSWSPPQTFIILLRTRFWLNLLQEKWPYEIRELVILYKCGSLDLLCFPKLPLQASSYSSSCFALRSRFKHISSLDFSSATCLTVSNLDWFLWHSAGLLRIDLEHHRLMLCRLWNCIILYFYMFMWLILRKI